MTINYKFNIVLVKKRANQGDFADVVTEAHFNVEATSVPVVEQVGAAEDGSPITAITRPAFSFSSGGRKPFDVASLDSETFVPFEQITNETIIQWLLDEEGVTDIEEYSHVKFAINGVARQIYEYGTEVSVSLPGNQVSGTSTATYTPTTEQPAG